MHKCGSQTLQPDGSATATRRELSSSDVPELSEGHTPRNHIVPRFGPRGGLFSQRCHDTIKLWGGQRQPGDAGSAGGVVTGATRSVNSDFHYANELISQPPPPRLEGGTSPKISASDGLVREP
ncbi:hypothetical protein EVAR_36475_1 [Eumeta japonica]|uniref:Uncharacterized protein n=1 Tax=Eumeta variegata TaxID=151549 RepID=A0A4C1WTR8_EUMVA|nr:hypothetical protein EVAR_36475_1 [Eumeta japonica]